MQLFPLCWPSDVDSDRRFYKFHTLKTAEYSGIVMGLFSHQSVIVFSLREEMCNKVLTQHIHHFHNVTQTHSFKFSVWAPLYMQAERCWL
jgi:hypothetical protein